MVFFLLPLLAAAVTVTVHILDKAVHEYRFVLGYALIEDCYRDLEGTAICV